MRVSEKGQVTIPKHIRVAAGWAVKQLQRQSERAPLHINLVICAELLAPGTDVNALDALLGGYDTLRSPLPWACAALTAAAFGLYRGRGGAKHKPMPAFYIGSRAAVAHLGVVTRDIAPYKSYSPRLVLATP